MRKFPFLTWLMLSIVACTVTALQQQEKPAKPNILFIMSEDLRPELPFYGNLGVIAPNLQRLAEKSLVFDHALCQVSICAPSRASLLTGLRPDTLGVYDFSHFGGLRFMRTIPSHFHAAGYQTAQSGKTHHWESSKHYSRMYYGHPSWEETQKDEMRFHNASVTPDDLHEPRGLMGEKPFFRDTHIASHAVTFLRQLHAESAAATTDGEGKPWFLAVGFKGTHMQYQMPKRFWDAYSEHTFPLPDEEGGGGDRTSSSYHPSLTYPPGAPHAGHVTSAESRYIMYMKGEGSQVGDDREPYQRIGSGRSISSRGWAELYRGYLACLSHMDSQLGRVLDELDSLRLWENTVVVFTSDHGMHVGEKGMWSKWSLFDEAARVPLLIHDPSSPGSQGQHYRQPVELIDLFPTLADMADAPLTDSSSSCESPAVPHAQDELSSAPDPEMAKRVFRHRYCDKLDGASLRPVFTGLEAQRVAGKTGKLESTSMRPFPFALTQKQACKSQGVAKKVSKTSPSSASAGYFGNTQTEISKIDGRLIDAYGNGWLDFCPVRSASADRHPNYGLMGYSMRTVDWRYTAWFLLDINTLLPALDVAPLAEELYDHRVVVSNDENSVRMNDPKVVNSVVGKAELVNQVNSTADGGVFQSVRERLRRSMYDFLYYNASHAHVFQGRVQEQEKMLHELSTSLGKTGSNDALRKKVDGWSNVVENRIHDTHPHWKLYKKHFYSQ